MAPDFARRYHKSALYFTRPTDDDETFIEVPHGDVRWQRRASGFSSLARRMRSWTKRPRRFRREVSPAIWHSAEIDERVELAVTVESQTGLRRGCKSCAKIERALSVGRPSCV